MSSTRKSLATAVAIKNHWYKWLEGNNRVSEGKYCFACGSIYKIERAHLKAKIEGGEGTANNLVLLCGGCHHKTEGASVEEIISFIISTRFSPVYVAMETRRKKKGYSDDMENVDDIYFQAQSIGLEKALIELSKELKISIEELKDKLAPLHPSKDLKKYFMELARSFTPNGINRTKASALLKDKNFPYNKK